MVDALCLSLATLNLFQKAIILEVRSDSELLVCQYLRTAFRSFRMWLLLAPAMFHLLKVHDFSKYMRACYCRLKRFSILRWKLSRASVPNKKISKRPLRIVEGSWLNEICSFSPRSECLVKEFANISTSSEKQTDRRLANVTEVLTASKLARQHLLMVTGYHFRKL